MEEFTNYIIQRIQDLDIEKYIKEIQNILIIDFVKIACNYFGKNVLER